METKNEIVEKVKNGMSVAEAGKQYAVSTKTIYTWLSNQARPEISINEDQGFKNQGGN